MGARQRCAFRRDPQTVTIFGESGGGAKVSTLMTTQRAKGLFHRAVVQSGAMLRFPDAERARRASDEVVAKLGVARGTIGELKHLPTEAIQEAVTGTGAATAPTIDGRTLTRHPFEPDAAPAGRGVPLMLGTNRTENSLFVGANPTVFELTWDGLTPAMKRAYPQRDVDAVIEEYRRLQPESNPSDIYLEATSDELCALACRPCRSNGTKSCAGWRTDLVVPLRLGHARRRWQVAFAPRLGDRLRL